MVTEYILIEARRYLDSYCQSFNTEDHIIRNSINLKKEHTLRVVANTERLCTSLFLNEEQKVLAEIIALFHDVGRFSQFVHARTFAEDVPEDHALLSAKIIEKADFFSEIDEVSQKLIVEAIQNHSKIQLPKIEDTQVLLFCQLIRDADKLDTMEILIAHQIDEQIAEMESSILELPMIGIVSEKVLKCIEQQKPVKKEDLKCMNDFKLMIMSWIFDLNFKASFAIINHNRYIEKLYNNLPKQDGIISAYRTIKLHIENRFIE